MAYVNPIEQLGQAEKDLEEKIYGTPSETDTKGTEATTQDTTEKTEAPEATELVTQEQKPEVQKEPVEDWEKRYKNLRASRDESLYKTKMQLTEALSSIQALREEISRMRAAAPKVDPLEGVFTEEDTETLGEATVEAMRKVTRKATEAATAPIQRELEEERKRRHELDKKVAEDAKQDAYKIFLSRIAEAVPHWETINYDPEFIRFMEEPDYDGTPRKEYFHEAEAQGKPAHIIRYMKEFENSRVAKPKANALAAKVTPVGDGSGAASTGEKKPEVFTRAQVNKFYDDLARGRYKGRESEANALEDRIDKAVMGGRVVDK